MEIVKIATLKNEYTNEWGDKISASEQMGNPGDYYYALSQGDRIKEYIIINCPFCKVPISLPSHTLTCQKGEPLTIKEEIFCSYQKVHHFKINEGNIIILGVLSKIYG